MKKTITILLAAVLLLSLAACGGSSSNAILDQLQTKLENIVFTTGDLEVLDTDEGVSFSKEGSGIILTGTADKNKNIKSIEIKSSRADIDKLKDTEALAGLVKKVATDVDSCTYSEFSTVLFSMATFTIYSLLTGDSNSKDSPSLNDLFVNEQITKNKWSFECDTTNAEYVIVKATHID